MHVHATDDFIETRSTESLPLEPLSGLQPSVLPSSAALSSPVQSASSKQPCPRSVRAWRAWLGALGNDAEAAQAAALAYEQLDGSGRDAWIDSLAQDAMELGIPRIA